MLVYSVGLPSMLAEHNQERPSRALTGGENESKGSREASEEASSGEIQDASRMCSCSGTHWTSNDRHTREWVLVQPSDRREVDTLSKFVE